MNGFGDYSYTTVGLMATAPGLALYDGGLARPKNTLHTMTQAVLPLGYMSVAWAAAGFTLAFGEGTDVIGDLSYAFLRGVGIQPNAAVPTIPSALLAFRELVLFIAAAGLLSGACAERMRASVLVAFTTLWGLLVYCPVAHIVRGGGLLSRPGDFDADFAGGIAVHTVAGVSALVCSLIIGPRARQMQPWQPLPSNPAVVAAGASMLWAGWLALIAGMSHDAATPARVGALVAGHLCIAAAMTTTMVLDMLRSGRPTAVGASQGAVAGIAAAASCSGQATPAAAMAIGATVALASSLYKFSVARSANYDDAADVFAVTGVGGTCGALLSGSLGYIGGGAAAPVLHTLQAVVTAVLIAGVGTSLLLVLLRFVTPLRSSPETEAEGLDLDEASPMAFDR